MSIYDLNGRVVAPSVSEDFMKDSSLSYVRDEATGTSFYIIRVFRTKPDGTSQYPFISIPNGTNPGTKSTLEMNRICKYPFAINAGLGDSSGGGWVPIGLVIENGVLIQNSDSSHSHLHPLTIDNNGNLGYAEGDADGQTLIANGVVSAITGFYPLVVNYDPVPESYYNYSDSYLNKAQRQIIGQYGNGDYAIVTCEGRGFDNSSGWTIPEVIAICQKLGLKFAYNLDGGGSTETVFDQKQINTIYEGTSGRSTSSYIVFNGTTTFGEPE